ncbi:MAG: PstS family phosphate ABC transporter substrate-binding protein [Chitinispirillaceae bacterium]|nr:PstS family phosphate ABC transporter substrate-binding protein [Chitinispirillaceae bacterium]
MNCSAKMVFASLTLCGVLFSSGCGKKEVPSIRIYGSTTLEPFMSAAVKAYQKKRDVTFDIKAIGSRDGIDSLISGSCDMAMSSMEISSDLIEQEKKKGVSLKPFLLGYDAIIPIVNPKNLVSDISYQQLLDIYRGVIKNWSVLGGKDTAIDVVERTDASGTHFIWHKDVVPPGTVSDHFTTRESNSALTGYVADHSNAIGYTSAVFVNPELKALHIDGISIAENDSLLSQYHLKRQLLLYVNEDEMDGELRSFLTFLIFDEQGRKLLKESGFFTNYAHGSL